jgi:hypothetical protein
MALPRDEQLDLLEKTVEAVAQAQQEDTKKTTDKSEAQRLLEEAKRMIQLQRETPIMPEVTSIVITLVTLREEGEMETPRNTSIGEYNEQQSLRENTIGEPKTEPTTAISTNPSVLREVAHVIVDLIMIYDSDIEEVDTTVPILNEAVTGMLDTQFPQGPQPLDIETSLNTTEGHITSSDRTS